LAANAEDAARATASTTSSTQVGSAAGLLISAIVVFDERTTEIPRPSRCAGGRALLEQAVEAVA
jgi:hypothetical protein